MSKKTTRIPRFHDMCVRDRVKISGLKDMAMELATGGLLPVQATDLVENVIGVISYPLAIVPNFIVDGEEVFIPIATEEPSVVAAASRGAKLAREGGGFFTEVSDPITTVQILLNNPSLDGVQNLKEKSKEILESVRDRHKTIKELGGGPRDLEVRFLNNKRVIVQINIDTRDALGANIVDDIGEFLSPQIKAITHGDIIGSIVTNSFTKRTVKATAKYPIVSLEKGGFSSKTALDRFLELAKWAEDDPYRAVTHNKGIMNGVIGVALATGNDTRALEASAHFLASKKGKYSPLSSWSVNGDFIEGKITIPYAFATVGGMTTKHTLVHNLLKSLNISSSKKLASLAASVGLACNFSALSIIATEGIQKGHMSLARRSLK